MTALKEYDRLEATGLWRASPEAQRREVYVSIGEATLTIANFNSQALTHWSLAAIERQNPGAFPAIYHPDGDPGETLELADSETQMIEAIERLRRAVERARPRPGRLRSVGVAAMLAAMVAFLGLWLPGAMMRHTLEVMPDIKRQEIGEALLSRLERVSGRACRSNDATPILARLARRLDVRRLVILPGGVRDSLQLPGGVMVLNKTLVEDFEDPAVLAGYILAERTRAEMHNPMAEMLDQGGILASFRLLTTGGLTREMLDLYAEYVLVAERAPVPTDRLVAVFEAAGISSGPYGFARDITGETTLPLIEADPMAGKDPVPVMRDRDWVQLQSICGG